MTDPVARRNMILNLRLHDMHHFAMAVKKIIDSGLPYIHISNTVKLGDKELFGQPKIVP